jgi:hypothetical protein
MRLFSTGWLRAGSVVMPWRGILRGFYFALALWLVISLWAISHLLVYETVAAVATRDQLFWHIYTLRGFLGYGATVGLLNRKSSRPRNALSEQGQTTTKETTR